LRREKLNKEKHLGCKALQLKDYFQLIDGSINAREVNGVKQSYKYDQMGQLLAVVNAAGGKVEQYCDFANYFPLIVI